MFIRNEYKATNYICPKCKASVDVLCTEPKRDGSYFIATPHKERIDLAKKMEKEDYQLHGDPDKIKDFFLDYFTYAKKKEL